MKRILTNSKNSRTKRKLLCSVWSTAIFLCFFDEFFAAFRTADVDFTAVFRHANGLAALRTAEIAVRAVAQAVPEIQKSLIFTTALVDTARKAAEKLIKQKCIGQ